MYVGFTIGELDPPASTFGEYLGGGRDLLTHWSKSKALMVAKICAFQNKWLLVSSLIGTKLKNFATEGKSSCELEDKEEFDWGNEAALQSWLDTMGVYQKLWYHVTRVLDVKWRNRKSHYKNENERFWRIPQSMN